MTYIMVFDDTGFMCRWSEFSVYNPENFRLARKLYPLDKISLSYHLFSYYEENDYFDDFFEDL